MWNFEDCCNHDCTYTALAFNFENKLKRQCRLSHVPLLQQAHWKWVEMDLRAAHSVLLVGCRGWQFPLAVRSWRRTGSFASVRCVEENLWHLGIWSCVSTISTGWSCSFDSALLLNAFMAAFAGTAFPFRLSPSHLWLSSPSSPP